MGDLAAQRAQLSMPVLPRRGLDELLRGWTSDGQVYEALSAVSSAETFVEWSTRDIERRAARVLLERMAEDIQRLPVDPSGWLPYIPVTTTSSREVAARPLRPTDWSATARRFGWPPSAFVGHPRTRVRDETTLRVLVWAARRLDAMLRDVSPVAKLLAGQVEPHIAAMTEIVNRELGDVDAERPDRLDIRSLAGSGTPWSTLAAVTDALVRAETDLEFLAYEIIEPIPDLEWRLFHLSVLGEVLGALRALGGRVRWTAPLSASQSTGPQFQVTIGQDVWDLWFEASGAAKRYGVESPYRAATSAVNVTQRTIGADVMLCRPGSKALMFECKWSVDGTYVGRDGYHQASSYLVEARAGIVTDAWSYVIGPAEVVPARSETELAWPGGVAVLGAANIDHVAELVQAVVTDSHA
ncbi:Uncharacterised protein [Mycobacteroides abscessus subsp. massiliense]|uniref:hypothetical protein n=1 Tax=Mycobacteroides abscessus TaxID=36809 RepID=UPI0009C7DA61|nr:hypothetical protein [Mycobacteroides abscessus]SLH42488.1 Uncharacterised protein [Mycobacteroides abscessus subsp. massiliense]